ncbi:hypothetical protein GCM10010266_34210 [Streptomyces griseomycini]|uniref:hypothetical protein n=1 Tax=Streptomyces griseomycini TaxID=66895 RepID=UPI001876666B|nr:hypothetical protein [Streptomyces griseomycini]GGQ08079.1 hypothetical protein GCM10010266_34210 [Streptomyces griseomycini]
MNADRTTRRVLMVMPGPALVRAAVAAGFEVWAMADAVFLAPKLLQRAGVEPHRLLPGGLTDPVALRALLEHTADAYGIDQLLYAEGEVRDMLCPVLGAEDAGRVAARAHDVVRDLSRKLGGPVGVLPGAAALRRLHEQGGYPGPHLGGQMTAGHRVRVRTLTIDGMHLVADIAVREAETARTTSPTEAEWAGIRATVRALLDLAGYEHGSVQTEVVLAPNGCHVVGVTS